MKKLISLLLALMVCCTLASSYAQGQSRKLHLDVEFDANIMMARYDVAVYLNDEKVAQIPHGKTLDAIFSVPEGLCELTFAKIDDPDVYVTSYLSITQDTEVECEIHANLSDLEFRSLTTNCDSILHCVNEGEFVDMDNFQLSVARHRTASSYGSFLPESGKVFLICELEYYNHTQEPLDILALTDIVNCDACCDGYEIDLDFQAMYNLPTDFELTTKNVITAIEQVLQKSESVHPGKRVVVELVMQVPPDWQEVEIYYSTSLYAANEVVFVVQND